MPVQQKVETRVTGRGAKSIASVTAVPASPTSAAVSGSAVPSHAASRSSCSIPASAIAPRAASASNSR